MKGGDTLSIHMTCEWHFMTNKSIKPRPLAFHLALLRQRFGTRGITQRELGELIGVSPSQMTTYENQTRLPYQVAMTLKISILMEQPISALYSPTIVLQYWQEIADACRKQNIQPPAKPQLHSDPSTLVVSYRNSFLTAVLMSRGHPAMVVQTRPYRSAQAARAWLARLMMSYATKTIVIESDNKASQWIPPHTAIAEISLEEAMSVLPLSSTPTNIQELCELLLAKYPELSRHLSADVHSTQKAPCKPSDLAKLVTMALGVTWSVHQTFD